MIIGIIGTLFLFGFLFMLLSALDDIDGVDVDPELDIERAEREHDEREN